MANFKDETKRYWVATDSKGHEIGVTARTRETAESATTRMAGEPVKVRELSIVEWNRRQERTAALARAAKQ